MLKNPLLGFREFPTTETKLLAEFLEFVSWVREHIVRKVKLKQLLEALGPQMQQSRNILAKTLRKINEIAKN